MASRGSRCADLGEAGPDATVYELAPATGQVHFGDGVHGAVPAAGDIVRASYRSVHEGYLAFARAMHEVDPDIAVCASWGRQVFVELMGSRPYDCLTTHSIVPFGEVRWENALEGHDRQMLALAGRHASVRALKATMPSGTPLLITEYSFIGGDFDAYPAWQSTMGHVAAVASVWVSWLRLGLRWAQGDDLLWANRGVIGPPPDYVFTADALARQAVHPMYEARGDVVATDVLGNPIRDTGLGEDRTYPALAATASRARQRRRMGARGQPAPLRDLAGAGGGAGCPAQQRPAGAGGRQRSVHRLERARCATHRAARARAAARWTRPVSGTCSRPTR